MNVVLKANFSRWCYRAWRSQCNASLGVFRVFYDVPECYVITHW